MGIYIKPAMYESEYTKKANRISIDRRYENIANMTDNYDSDAYTCYGPLRMSKLNGRLRR